MDVPKNEKSDNVVGEEKEDNHRTTGEELYLVHLSRFANPGPEDYDRDGEFKANGKRKDRSLSLGEELWQIHCRRSQGCCEEEDEEVPNGAGAKIEAADAPSSARDSPSPKTKQQQRRQPKMTNEEERVMHLRNRDVPLR